MRLSSSMHRIITDVVIFLLKLEASTTSAKAMVYGAESGIQCMAAEAYPPGTGGETQDADAVFALLMKLGREAAAGRNIDAVSLGGTWHNLLVCGEAMRPLGRAYTWQWMGARGSVSYTHLDVYKRQG